MKYIYILLSRTETVVSRMIGTVTGDSFTHVSISLDRDMNQLYSFARRKVSNPIIAGFIHEHIDTGIFALNKDCPCRIYKVPVSEKDFQRISKRISYMNAHSRYFSYNILGLLLCAIGIAIHRKRKFYCSQFVGSILEMADSVTLPKDPFRMKPIDFTGIDDAILVYSGPLYCCRCEQLPAACEDSVDGIAVSSLAG